jgi:hypothetical protein
MGVSGLGLEGLTSDSAGGGGGVPDSPLILQAFGVVGAPELAFLGDEDTGLYRPAVNTLGLVAGGVELARISALSDAFLRAGTDPAANGGDLGLSAGDSGVAATGDGGDVNILAGSSVATTGDGGIVSIKSGDGFFQGAGGDILVEVGSGGAAGPGTSGNLFVNTLTGLNAAAGLQVPIPGLVSIYGIGRSGSGPAGNLELWGGYASGAGGGSIGGDAIMWGGGQGGGAGEGGDAAIIGGESDTQPGDARVIGGVATTGGTGGAAIVAGGAGFGTNFGGGLARVDGGLGIGTGNGGQANLLGGGSGSGATGDGGNAEVVGGASNATDGNGGDVVIQSGAGAGGGDAGEIIVSIGGSVQYRIDAGTGLHGETAAGPVLRNVGASSVTPNLIPNRTDLNTGVGWRSADQGELIAGGVGAFTFAESGGVITNTFRGNLQAAGGGGAGPVLLNTSASASVPTVIPNQADPDTGLSRDTINGLTMIAGGLGCIRARNIGAARAVGFYVTTPIILQTGVAVTASGVHAALVALGLITA